MKIKNLVISLIIVALCFNLFCVSAFAVSEDDMINIINSPEMQDYINHAMDIEKAPGVSIVMTNGESSVYSQYGFADIKGNKYANKSTLYELGSTTKAFTALAILILDDEGIISIDKNISDYIPWFNVNYNGENVEITIKQLLHHSSGLPAKLENDFPEGTTDDLLEETARLTDSASLNFYPGTQYEYSNIGYDFLAYLLEYVTEDKFEDFVANRILIPLGMTNSSFSTNIAYKSDNMSKGYSQFFGKAVEYDAPRYQGCLADGYLITSAEDMNLWLIAQLGKGDVPEQLARLIEKSHVIDEDNTVIIRSSSNRNYYYTYGWEVSADGSIIYHNGMNPNYASDIVISMEKNTATCVLSNISGYHAVHIGNALTRKLYDKELSEPYAYNAKVDMYASIAICVELILIICCIILIATQNARIAKKVITNTRKERIIFISKLVILLVLAVFIAIWPYLIEYSYYMVIVWMPKTLFICSAGALILVILMIVLSITKMLAIRSMTVKKF